MHVHIIFLVSTVSPVTARLLLSLHTLPLGLETWQGLGISNSRADLQRFALDLAKTMEMEYIAPVSRIAYQQVSSLQRHGEEGEVFDGDGDDDVEEVSKNASTNRRFV